MSLGELTPYVFVFVTVNGVRENFKADGFQYQI